MADAVLELKDVRKNYSGLRPLRVRHLSVAPGERVAVSGFDAGAAEMLVNLITGATLPDEGQVITFGRGTSEIADGDAWLASLEAFGILSPRAVVLDSATLQQNLAMPFTLQIEPVPEDIARKVEALAAECGIDPRTLSSTVGEQSPAVRARLHLARALAIEPKLLLLEHPTAGVADEDRVPLARNVAAVAGARSLATLVITQDLEFAEAMAHRSLAVEPATGALLPWKRKRGWFR